jgi:YrhK-like protein
MALIGALFACGSLCFVVAPFPGFVQLVGPGADGAVFFACSLLFTSAAALQLAETHGPPRGAWWASAVQLTGTVLFNISTYHALQEGLSTSDENRRVWAPDALGSVCFLVASVIGWLVVRRSSRTPDRQIAALNLAGSVAFGVAAVASYVVPDTGSVLDLAAANVTTVIGALCFLAGALLLMRTAARAGSRP